MTPFQKKLIDERKARLARIAACAVPDKPVECFSASERSSRAEARQKHKLDAVKPFQEKEWVERQIERFSIPEMKKLWFSISDRPSAISVHTIQRVVCDHYRMRMSDMQSSRRMRGLVRPRQVAMYLCRILTSKSLPEIGRRFGGRDHTTILHAIKQIEAFKITDPDIAADVQHLTNLLEEKANEAATVASHRIASSQDEACGSDR